MKSIVTAVQSKNLKWEADFVRSIDHLTALGMCDALGSAALRFKFCNQRDALPRAVALLTKRAAGRMGKVATYVKPLATAAILEWTFDACDVCKGAGSLTLQSGLSCTCTKCSGSGLRRYADHERAIAARVPVDTWKSRERGFLITQEVLSGAVTDTIGKARSLMREETETSVEDECAA